MSLHPPTRKLFSESLCLLTRRVSHFAQKEGSEVTGGGFAEVCCDTCWMAAPSFLVFFFLWGGGGGERRGRAGGSGSSCQASPCLSW